LPQVVGVGGRGEVVACECGDLADVHPGEIAKGGGVILRGIERGVLAASYSKNDYGKDSGSRHAMGKAAEYGVPRYVIYDAARDAADPMFNLSREEIRTGAKVVTPRTVDAIKLVSTDEQLMFTI